MKEIEKAYYKIGFEKGKIYESLRKEVYFHLFLGYSCLGFGLIWLFFSVWDFQTRFSGFLGFLTFGLISLFLGYAERRRLKNSIKN